MITMREGYMRRESLFAQEPYTYQPPLFCDKGMGIMEIIEGGNPVAMFEEDESWNLGMALMIGASPQ